MSHEHLKASWRAEVEAIVRAELSKMEAELARMHHQVEQSFTQLLSQSSARLAAVSQEPAIADFAERAMAQMAMLSATSSPAPSLAQTSAPAKEVPPSAEETSGEATAPPSTATPAPLPTIDLQALYSYLLEIQSQPTQAEVLNLLVTRAVEYAPRVALFVVKSGNIIAWTERGFETAGISLRGLTIPLEAKTTLFAALEQQTAVIDSPYAYTENQILLDRIGQVPGAIAGIPLLVRGKAAAVIYVDSGAQPAEQIAIPPLQILTNVAGLTVELLNARSRLATTTVAVTERTTQTMTPPPVTTEAPSLPTTTSEPQVRTTATVTDAEAAAESSPPQDSVTETDSTAAQVMTYQAEQPETPGPVSAEYGAETPVDPGGPTMAEYQPAPQASIQPDDYLAGDNQPDSKAQATVPEMVSATVETNLEYPEPEFRPEPLPSYIPSGPTIQEPTSISPAVVEPQPPSFTPIWTQPSPEPQPQVQPSPPSVPPVESGTVQPAPDNGFTVVPLSPRINEPAPQPSRPVSVAAPVLPPKPTTEEEAKAHNDARRFARLLVSEIKLYNEAKVMEGRINRDLYDRLKEDIDRSRQMYDKRVNPIVAAKFDYFYDELVSSLAEGDPSRLGPDCPGPALVQPE
ncbi:MAG: hypothetical protein ACUVR8_11160 [Acidobacteriota bacterium]